MGVGAAESERVHPDYRVARSREMADPFRNVDLQLRERDVAGRSLEMQIGRDVSVLDHQRRLDQSGHAGAGLEVADVGLDRSDQEGIRRRPIQRQRTCECPHLDGVADGRSGAVRFDVSDLGRLDARPSKSSPDGRFLGFLARHGDAVGVAVLRHRRAEDLRVDLVAVVERPLKRFDDDDRAAFSARVTVRGVVEGLGTSFGTEESALRFRDGGVGADHDVHAAGEGEIALAVPDALRRKVHRDERAGARGVDRHAGSAEVEGVRDPVRQHRHHHPGG